MTTEINPNPEVDDPPVDTAECYECGDEFAETELSYDSGGQLLCEDCTATCADCRDTWPSESSRIRHIDGEPYCGDCRSRCGHCGSWVAHNHWSSVWSEVSCEYLHEGCATYCEGCEQSIPREYECCETMGEEIESYGHTSPSMWLKTPDQQPGQGLYYLGIELEIGTSHMSGVEVRDWAEANMGQRMAMVCKEDSSVEGFEIVTQPMTPEFFESMNWDSFFEVLDNHHGGVFEESEEHGLHVHIGRTAFRTKHRVLGEVSDDLAIAAFCYLIGQSDHMERIGRREATGYCRKVPKPASAAIVARNRNTAQRQRLQRQGVYAGRDAINLSNGSTIEIRAFRSTRVASELKDAVRLVYTCAEYIRHLRARPEGFTPDALQWMEFARWVGVNYPDAFASVADAGTNDPDRLDYLRWMGEHRPEKFADQMKHLIPPKKVRPQTRVTSRRHPVDEARQAAEDALLSDSELDRQIDHANAMTIARCGCRQCNDYAEMTERLEAERTRRQVYRETPAWRVLGTLAF